MNQVEFESMFDEVIALEEEPVKLAQVIDGKIIVPVSSNYVFYVANDVGETVRMMWTEDGRMVPVDGYSL